MSDTFSYSNPKFRATMRNIIDPLVQAEELAMCQKFSKEVGVD